jgi:hypothetical protein
LKDIFNCLIGDLTFTADLVKDSNNFLVKHKKFRIAEHSLRVAKKAKMDKILFVADKIEWDQDGLPPYINEIQEAINISLELAAFTYLKYLLDDNSKLKVIHPWLTDAYKELKEELGGLKCLS